MADDTHPQDLTMAELLETEGQAFEQLHRGDVVDGTVVGKAGDTLIVDVGAKAEGVVPSNEMRSLSPDERAGLDINASVLVYIVQPEAEDDQLVLSVDRARGEQGWRALQDRYDSGTVFESVVAGFNKGGLLVNFEGVNTFVPLSQVVDASPEREEDSTGLAEFVGRTLRLKVIEINRRRNRVILSERAAMQEWRSEQKDRLLGELREGEIRQGTITSIRNFGVFVDLGGADGLVHLSELSWDRDVSPQELFKVGDSVDVYVMKVDQDSKKIGLSIRRAKPEQWDEVVAEYEIGQLVSGVVTKLVTFGAFTRIEGPVEGLIHVSELVDRRISHPREVVAEGDVIPVKIVRIERDRHRLGLSLRASREEAEAVGWVFNESGGIQMLPEEIAKQFGVERGEPLPEKPLQDSAEETDEEQEGAEEGVHEDAVTSDGQDGNPQVQEESESTSKAATSKTAMEAALRKAGLSQDGLLTEIDEDK